MITPLLVAIKNDGANLTVETNWRISRASSSYRLYECLDFGPSGRAEGIPEDGDVFGLVRQLVVKARLENSGVTMIRVAGRSISIDYSKACAPRYIRDLFMAALRTCGARHEIVSDNTPEG